MVVPTDTVYGLAADAFNAVAVARLLEAKGRTRAAPPPVLIPDVAALSALAATVPHDVNDLVAELWPGALTIILPSQPSLAWDLGDTVGTVALRMPNHPIALELLAETGPLAVSSANHTGNRPTVTADAAERELGDSASVYLDDGKLGAVSSRAPREEGAEASTIIDATRLADGGGGIRIVRHGIISAARIREIVGDALETVDE